MLVSLPVLFSKDEMRRWPQFSWLTMLRWLKPYRQAVEMPHTVRHEPLNPRGKTNCDGGHSPVPALGRWKQGMGVEFPELAGRLAWLKGTSGFSEPLKALRLVQP